MTDPTVFASTRNWTPGAAQHCLRKHRVDLTDRGEVSHNGEVVGTYELAGGVLVFRDFPHDSPLVAAFEMRQVS